MKKLMLVAAVAAVSMTTFAGKVAKPYASDKMQLDYGNMVKVMWCFNSNEMQNQPATKCVQRFRGDAIRGESATVHGVALGIGQTRVKGSVIGWQGTIVMSKIDGDVMGACGATGCTKVDGKVMGFQGALGAAKCQKLQNGCQFAVCTRAEESAGVQVGIVNKTVKAEKRKGIQIGLINFCDNSKMPVFPFVNGPWLFGEK